MVDTQRPGLLERIEAEACVAQHLSYWLLVLTVIALPWSLGMGCLVLADKAFGPMPGNLYLAVALIQCVPSWIAVYRMQWPSTQSFFYRLLRQPNPWEAKPGVFRLGVGFLGAIYRHWWGMPAIFVGAVVLFSLGGSRGEGEELYWTLMAHIGLFMVAILMLIGLLFLAGLFVWWRLPDGGVSRDV